MGSGCSSDKSAGVAGNSAIPLSNNMLKTQTVPALKLAVVGDAAVGKTNILHRYLRNQFFPLYIATQRAVIENKVMKVNLPSHALVSLTLWDIPGKEDIDLYKSYFRNLDAAIVVVDVSDEESVMMANVWKQIIMNNIEKTEVQGETTPALAVDPEKFPVLLLGTKCDIIEQRLQAEGKSLYPKGKRLKDTEFSQLDESVEKPGVEVVKPQCVLQLEQLAQQHGFVGSVVVSARDGDGSVHTAIQSFLRHILEEDHMERRWKPHDYKSGERKEEPSKIETVGIEQVEKEEGDNMNKDEEQPQHSSILDIVGIEKIDKTFNGKELRKVFERIDKLKHVHTKSLKKFQSLCTQVGVVSQEEANSLETCIVGLRRFMAEADFKLHLTEKKQACKLKVERLNKDTEMSDALKDILNTFNKEFVASGTAIVQEFPPFEEYMSKVDNKVATLVAMYEEPVEADTQAEEICKAVKSKSTKIEKNRGVIKYYQNQAKKCREDVDGLTERVNTAFMW